MKNTSEKQLNGLELLNSFIPDAPTLSGVYQMVNAKGEIIYIGKAKNIKTRIRNYTQVERLPKRLQLMVYDISLVQFQTTENELEALFLEAQLIEKHQPRFNVLLKTPKNYYYALISNHAYPRVWKTRNKPTPEALYKSFGPYYSSQELDMVLDCLSSAFKARNCTDKYFSARTRPCLRYHIKRCSAPCCKKIDRGEYMSSIENIRDFLNGNSTRLQNSIYNKMSLYSEQMQYEKAATLRDQIRALTKIQTAQKIHIDLKTSTDVIGIASNSNKTCICLNSYQNGRLDDSSTFIIDNGSNAEQSEVISGFLKQRYQSNLPPSLILLSDECTERTLIENWLCAKANKAVKLLVPKRHEKLELVLYAKAKAKETLTSLKNDTGQDENCIKDLEKALNIPQNTIQRIEIFDNSHISGQFAYGGMVVYELGRGFNKSEYRLFKMPNKNGNDLLMMEEMLQRRLNKLSNTKPNLLIIDGGRTQLEIANKCLIKYDSNIQAISIAKGEKRNSGDETIYYNNQDLKIPKNNPLLFFLQRLRDESHRFVITSHRKARGKGVFSSALDKISGVGKAKQKELLVHFGSINQIKSASIKDLSKIRGISVKIAQNIFNSLHKLDK